MWNTYIWQSQNKHYSLGSREMGFVVLGLALTTNNIFSFFELLPKLFLVWRAQLIPILVKRAGSGVCLCEMLGLRIKVSDTFGFRIRMGRKKGGLLVEIVKHQGKIISLGLRKLTTKYALCLHVQHIYMKITIQWDLVRCASSFWAGLSPT